MQPIPADAPIAITLEAQQWQFVVGVIETNVVYRSARPLLDEMSRQFEAAAATFATAAPAINGAAEHVSD